MRKQDKELRSFLHQRVYTHSSMDKDRSTAKKIINELFSNYLENNNLLPDSTSKLCKDKSISEKAYLICDYIASLTDRSATANHAKIVKQKN